MPPVWKVCPFKERYEIGDHGYIRNARTKKVLKPHFVKGYARITLRAGTGKKNYLIHRLVLLTFTGPSNDPAKNQAAHLNGKQFDNRLENLEWKDQLGNHEDKVKHGTAKLTKKRVAVMHNQFANGATVAELSERFCVCRRHVQSIVSGSRWQT